MPHAIIPLWAKQVYRHGRSRNLTVSRYYFLESWARKYASRVHTTLCCRWASFSQTHPLYTRHKRKNLPSEAPIPKHISIGPCNAFGFYELYNALGKTVTAVFASMKLRLVPTILHRRASARKGGTKAHYIRQDTVWGQYCRFETGCQGISLYTCYLGAGTKFKVRTSRFHCSPQKLALPTSPEVKLPSSNVTAMSSSTKAITRTSIASTSQA